MSTLFMVATPIGNLRDITLRALDTLREVDAIACEDTRHSLRLLNAHEIRKPLIPCHSHNEQAAAERILGLMKDGKDVAFVSDAGTPGISDPGTVLVRAVRDAGYDVVPLPGPSAMAAIMSVNPFPGKRMIFEGFLSPKSGRRKNQLKNLLELHDSFIIYESPFRIVKLLRDLETVESETEDPRMVLCGRELTKSHEELLEGTPGDVAAILESRQAVKGEFVVLVSPRVKRS